jgi:DNA polymerase-3 subunit chi
MAELRIYHLTAQSVTDGLPGLLHTAVARNLRCHVYVPDDNRSEKIADHLWTHRQDSFLPHGTKKDGLAEHQPIWISPDLKTPNNADVRFVIQGAEIEVDDLDEIDLTCILFDESDRDARQKARRLWTDSDEIDGLSRIYYRQDDNGKWHEAG